MYPTMKATLVILMLIVTSYGADQSNEGNIPQKDIRTVISFTQIEIKDLMKGVKELVASIESKHADDTTLKKASSTCPSVVESLNTQMLMLKTRYNVTLSKYKVDVGMMDGVQSKDDENETMEQVALNLNDNSYRPVDCADIAVQGKTQSGVYNIYPYQTRSSRTNQSIRVFCNMELDEGGWTGLFSLRNTGSNNTKAFSKSWKEFKEGFGNYGSEFWLGNDVVHALTSSAASTLRVEIEKQGSISWAEWKVFSIENGKNKYRITVEEFDDKRSTLHNIFSVSNKKFFSSYDRDNDESKDKNCARNLGSGGWWYGDCFQTRFTGKLSAMFRRRNCEYFANCSK